MEAPLILASRLKVLKYQEQNTQTLDAPMRAGEHLPCPLSLHTSHQKQSSVSGLTRFPERPRDRPCCVIPTLEGAVCWHGKGRYELKEEASTFHKLRE